MKRYLSDWAARVRGGGGAGRVLRDERGAEVLEYALVLGLIVVVAIVVIGTVGTKVLARWTSVNSKI